MLEDQCLSPASPPKLCKLPIKAWERLQPSGKERGRSGAASACMPPWLAGGAV